VQNAAQIAKRLQESARQALKETRLMLYDLQSPRLEAGQNLIRKLDERLEAVERRAGVRASIILEGSLNEIPDSWNENLFWITIEALNNALKHAQARNMKIKIHCSMRQVELEIEDDGIGFDPARVRAGGLGLNTMRERAEALGGKLEIFSEPGQGTRIFFQPKEWIPQ